MNLEYLKEHSIELTQQLNEELSIANTDEIVGEIIEMKFYNSLAYQICELAPIHGPTGHNYALIYDKSSHKLKLTRNGVIVHEDGLESTGITREAMQDMYNTFGKSANSFLAKAFAGISAANENKKLLSTLSTVSTPVSDLTLTTSDNVETMTFEIEQKVSEIILDINGSSYKSLDGFVVIPKKGAASVMNILNSVVSQFNSNGNSGGLYLGNSGRTKYYLNPDLTSTTCYVGINSEIPGMSSLVISPYQHSIIGVKSPDTGNVNMFNINRYAITESAMSVQEKMLYKFNIL